MRLSAENQALFAECAPAREHFAAGRRDAALAALANSSAFRGLTSEEIRRRVAMLHMEDLVEWARRNAELVVPVGPPSRPVRTVITYVVDKGGVSELPLSYAEAQPEVAVLNGLTFLLGSSMAMTPDDSLVRVAPRWGKGMKFLENVPGIIGWTENYKDLLFRLPPQAAPIPEAAYFFLNYRYYGGNIINLASMALIREVSGPTSMPLLTDVGRGIGPVEMAALRRMGFPDNEIITVRNDMATRVDRLWACHLPITWDHDPINSDTALNVLRQRLGVAPELGPGGPELVYTSRGDAKRRRVANEDEVLDVLRPLGFHVVKFAELDLQQRMDVLRSAKIVVGPGGSNLFNMAFGPPGAWAIEFVPDSWGRGLQDTIAQLMINLGNNRVKVHSKSIEDPDTKHNEWDMSVPIADLKTAVEFVMAQAL